jgi:type IV pilus modification protein PilV
MKTFGNTRSLRGFSLLEVLIAIVILSVGLLALASLQLSMIRSSSETKAQSAAMALAKEKIETLASYQTMGGSSSTCTSPTGGFAGSCYRAITDETAVAINNIGGVNYTRQTAVSRYIWNRSTNAFVLVGADTALDSAVKALNSSLYPGKEFKRVVVTVAWNDAGGVPQRVQVEDAISAIAPGDSMAVSTVSDTSKPRQAQKAGATPAGDGVIPIALGDGSETAATNPRPVIVSQGNSSTTVETRFNVLTYAYLSNTTVETQSEIETVIVGCKCTLGSGTQTANRPTYWDGFHYVTPVTAAGIPVSNPASGNVTQSSRCTACCRDHHDPSGVAGPKFDPRRSAHNHYLNTALNSPVTTAGGSYHEACRLIRVDGEFFVAAEPYDDHFGLLATAGLGANTPTTTVAGAVPASGTGSTTEQYQTYVINYLASRFVTGTNYNTTLDPTTVNGYSNLQLPASASITSSTSPQYMHSRGLLIDYLNTDALAAIASAKASCIATNCTTAQTQTAVLKLLPFTSINLTELAKWQSSNTSKISVSLLEDLSETLTSALPVSGRATFNSGANGDTVTATTDIQRTSAGLAIVDKVFPDSELPDNYLSNVMTDTQLFTIGSGGNNGSFPGGENFTVALSGTDLLANVTIANPAQVSFGSTSYKSCTPNGTTMTPYGCVTDTSFGLGGAANVKVGNYNRAGTVTVQNSCTRNNNANNAANSDTTAMPYAINFDVASANVDGTAGTISQVINPGIPGITGEYTIVNVNPVNVNSVVTVAFGNKTYLCPSNYTTFITSTGDDAGKTPDNSNSSTVCTGSGNNKTPVWDTTTWIACPSGGTPLQ